MPEEKEAEEEERGKGRKRRSRRGGGKRNHGVFSTVPSNPACVSARSGQWSGRAIEAIDVNVLLGVTALDLEREGRRSRSLLEAALAERATFSTSEETCGPTPLPSCPPTFAVAKKGSRPTQFSLHPARSWCKRRISSPPVLCSLQNSLALGILLIKSQPLAFFELSTVEENKEV